MKKENQTTREEGSDQTTVKEFFRRRDKKLVVNKVETRDEFWKRMLKEVKKGCK